MAEFSRDFYLASGYFALEFDKFMPNEVETYNVKFGSVDELEAFRQSESYRSYLEEPEESKIDELWKQCSSFIRKSNQNVYGTVSCETDVFTDDGHSLIVNVQQISEKQAAAVYYGGLETFELGAGSKEANRYSMENLIRGMLKSVTEYNLEAIKMYFYMGEEDAGELVRQILYVRSKTEDETCRELLEHIDMVLTCYEDYDLFLKPLEEKEEKEIRRISAFGEQPTVIGHTDKSDLKKLQKKYPDSTIWVEGNNIYARIGIEKVKKQKHDERQKRGESYREKREEIDKALSGVILNDAKRDVLGDMTLEEYLQEFRAKLDDGETGSANEKFAEFFYEFRLKKAQKIAEEDNVQATAKKSAAENVIAKIHGRLERELKLSNRKRITDSGTVLLFIFL
jgi:hypothetical protein